MTSSFADLRALEEAATPGPWESDSEGNVTGRGPAAFVCEGYGDSASDADAALIVAARNALPGLLARVEELEAERDALRRALTDLLEDVDDAYGPGDDGPALAAARAFLAARGVPAGPDEGHGT